MGKKKSAVLLTLLTVLIVGLCAMIVFPSFGGFSWKGAISNWNPVVKTYDLGADLGGGYYTYYYPEGVISENAYKSEYEGKEDDGKYKKIGNLYFSTDTDDGVLDDNGELTESFKTAFASAAKDVAARYEKKGYSSFRVSVVDDYAIRAELPVSDDSAANTFNYFSYFGEFTVTAGDDVLFEETREKKATDYFEKFAVETQKENAYVEIKLTKAGLTLFADATSSASSSAAVTLTFKIGENTLLATQVTSPVSERTLYSGGQDYSTIQAVVVAANSALNGCDYGISFTVDGVKTFEAAYGSNALTLLYIALGIVLLACLVLPIVKYGGYGVSILYSTLSYFIITTLCFAFITSGVFEITLGSMLVFLFGLVGTVFMNAHVYGAIKSEFQAGKTVESSVKAGYKKTLLGNVDIYVVLALSAVALLIGAAGLHTLAIQALICIAAGAFCNLLWARFLNFLFLSAAKDKYKYYRFVREDDDDE